MKVRILRNLGREFPRLAEGQVESVSEDLATALIARGLAEAVDGKGKTLKAVPPEAELVTPEAEAEFKAVTEKVKGKAKDA